MGTKKNDRICSHIDAVYTLNNGPEQRSVILNFIKFGKSEHTSSCLLCPLGLRNLHLEAKGRCLLIYNE